MKKSITFLTVLFFFFGKINANSLHVEVSEDENAYSYDKFVFTRNCTQFRDFYHEKDWDDYPTGTMFNYEPYIVSDLHKKDTEHPHQKTQALIDYERMQKGFKLIGFKSWITEEEFEKNGETWVRTKIEFERKASCKNEYNGKKYIISYMIWVKD